MVLPVGHMELLIPKPLLHALILLSSVRDLISSLFRSLGLGDFLEPGTSWPARPDCVPDPEPHLSAELIRYLIPVVQFSDLVDPPESCAVCLSDYDGADEVRRLASCRHVFHRRCLDRWVDHRHRTCPLCRTPFIPGWISDYDGDY